MKKNFRVLTLSLNAALVMTAGCASCEDGGLDSLSPVIQVTPAQILFGEVPSLVTSKGVITVRNLGTAPLKIVSITFDPDPTIFEMLDVPPEAVAPGNSFVIQVLAVAPSTVGAYLTDVVIQSDDPVQSEVRVPIRLEAVPAPPCDDGNVCTADWFDPDDKECKHSFADGVVCQPADRCVINASCRLGVCLGENKVCDDSSPCTQDYCRQTDGECFFVEAPSQCDDDNPCTFDTCSAASGCEHLDVAAGTPCDDGDECSQSDSCFAGSCQGRGLMDGSPCDDGDSCTNGDLCTSGVCSGSSIIQPAQEGDVVFTYPLTDWADAFLHRREVSLSDTGVLYGLDHLRLGEAGLTHVVFGMNQCGTDVYEFAYRPPDAHVWVSRVRRGIQISDNDVVRMYVGVRQTLETGFEPQTTTYVLESNGNVLSSGIQTVGGETGRSLLPDGSHIYGIVYPITFGVPPPDARQNLVIIREDVRGSVLWRHERNSQDIWAEFLGVAGPRVLFWESGRFGALDFNTGALVWSRPTEFITKEMALSTGLDLGVARTRDQVMGVEILNGEQVFSYPAMPDPTYKPRTDPVISSDGRILVMMERSIREPSGLISPAGLSWVELDLQGSVLSETSLPYAFPEDWGLTRHEDFSEDPYPTVADDGISYVGFGDSFWSIDPGGRIRWTLTSTIENAYTGTVPLLRDDGIMIISEKSRAMIGVKTNGGQMAPAGWPSFRHDGARTNFTP